MHSYWTTPRTARAALGGRCDHVINRGNALGAMLHQADECKAFSQVLREATARVSMRLLLVLGRDIDVFNMTAWWRDRKAVCFETFQMKFNGFADEAFRFCDGGASGDAAR